MRDLKIFTDNIEDKALQQVNELLEQDAFKDCKVRIMPDVHAGAGCVIGFTANLGDKVIPEVVGVDLGCGMTWAVLNKNEIDLKKLDKVIRENIPSGMTVREDALPTDINLKDLYCYDELRNKDNYLERSLGSLGGGNHFIEVDKSEDKLYLVIHSGSRNLGKQVCEIYQDRAIKHCSFEKEKNLETENIIKQLKEEGRQREIETAIKDIKKKYEGKLKLPKDLCYIEGEDRENYLHDMRICQKWASQNRLNILNILLEKMDLESVLTHETIHNYISDDNIVRKGAISAQKDEIVLIPMNMRDGCIIAKGKGNEDWNCSAPHGAGRIMSRNQARETLNIADYEKSMDGIYTTSVCKGTIDEAPMVYKPIEEIIDKIGDTVDIIDVIKPIYNFKAEE